MPKPKKPSDPFAEREAERYQNPIPSREYIIEQLSASGPMSFRSLAKCLKIKGQESRQALNSRLRAMQREGQILCNRAEEYGVVRKMDLIAGKVQAHKDGFGFLLVKDGEDIYLGPSEMRQLFNGDEVLVSPAGETRRGQLEGKVVEVLSRNTLHIVGRVHSDSGDYYIVPDNPRINHDIYIEGNQLQDANMGDYVTLEMTEYPAFRKRPKGKIVEVLGEPSAPGLEIDIAIRSHDIPHEWPAKCLEQASQYDDQPSEKDKKGRVDLRHLPLVTIDGEDARDFDDAVYCEKRQGGGYTLWVAIADVAHYVPVDTDLDQEAQRRGNSVYFPGRVVPMLPETISNGLCSLNPAVDRLCMVAEMTISAKGKLTKYAFYEAVMHSHARLTYTEVAEALGFLSREPREGLLKRVKPIFNHLKTLQALFETLRSTRATRGAIDFETTETRIVFNHLRKIDAIVPVTRNDAHKIIEECMLCANVAAANFLEKSGLDALYRVHEGPKVEKLKNLRTYLGELGLGLAGGENPTPKDYQQLMQVIEGRPDAHLIQMMMLRSLSQAVYDPENNGHFGLAYNAYAHFTSPIRRYPDLLVHRAIKHLIRSKKICDEVIRVKGAGIIAKKAIYPYDKQAMLVAGANCSMTERRADEATRDVVAWLKCEYLQEHIGETFDGVVAGVTGFGMFVELSELYVEGLVHISSLGKDYYHFEAATQRLVGERTRKVYRMGDDVSVVVASVDMDQRKVDLTLSGIDASTKKGKGNSKKNSKAKKKAKPKKKKNSARKRPGKASKRNGKKSKPKR